jgi:hypothetical protein
MGEAPLAPDEARRLRWLARLVTVLTAVMIAGVLVIVALLVIRLNRPPAQVALPAEISLPRGAAPLAVTAGPGWYLVVTRDERLFLFGGDGTLRREIPFLDAD